MRTAATPANAASMRYSFLRNVFAPALISSETSMMRLFSVFYRFTQRKRYAAKAKAMSTAKRDNA